MPILLFPYSKRIEATGDCVALQGYGSSSVGYVAWPQDDSSNAGGSVYRPIIRYEVTGEGDARQSYATSGSGNVVRREVIGIATVEEVLGGVHANGFVGDGDDVAAMMVECLINL